MLKAKVERMDEEEEEKEEQRVDKRDSDQGSLSLCFTRFRYFAFLSVSGVSSLFGFQIMLKHLISTRSLRPLPLQTSRSTLNN